MFEKLRQKIAQLIYPNSYTGRQLSNQFLRRGSGALRPEWNQVVMDKKDAYTGYMYAIIRNRANRIARVASDNIITESILEEDYDHPYQTLIWDSIEFSEYKFWTDISIYLDLLGVYYLMVIRGKSGKTYSPITEFKLLNPYNVKPVWGRDENALTLGGYTEEREGFTRAIPDHMIIPIYDLNPFNPKEPFSLTDAAQESQFTLKTAGDYTRTRLQKNLNSPGIVTTGVLLGDDEFANFKERVKAHEKGEPIFGNGPGAVNWTPMDANLKDSALGVINEMQREAMFAVGGVSKTMVGIEQSGTTRETAKVQKDLHTEDQSLPRIQLIIDALNLDYKSHYPDEYKSTEAYLICTNPLSVDHEADILDNEAKQGKLDLYTSLIDKGFAPDLAAKYIEGKITISELGTPEPKDEPKEEPIIPEEDKPVTEEVDSKIVNQFEDQRNGLVQQQEGFLKNVVVNIEEGITAIVLKRIVAKTAKNAFENVFKKESDVITETEKKGFINELEGSLTVFYGIMINLAGGEQMRNRQGEFAMAGNFDFGIKRITAYIKKMSYKVAKSHVDTVAKDLYGTAKAAALEGLGQDAIISRIKDKYTDLVETRAKVIARTEANRAFTEAQYEADIQFIDQNDLKGQAFKKWVTRSGNPCAFCEKLSNEDPIPLGRNFRSLGDIVEADGQKLPVSYTSLSFGNAHPNCSCTYELIIK